MPLVAAWKKQVVEKVQEQGGVFRDSATTHSTVAAFKTHFEYTFIIPTSGNILIWLVSVYWSACLTSTLSEICRLLMHRRFDFHCGLWPIIQIFLPGIEHYITKYIRIVKEIYSKYYISLTIVTVNIYFEVIEGDRYTESMTFHH